MTRRKSAASYKKELCVFCQENKTENAPHEVRPASMGARIKYVAVNSLDQSLKIRLAHLIATYINRLEENGVKNLRSDYKNHLTNWIQGNMYTKCTL